MSRYGFVTDSPLFDDPTGSGFYRPLTNEEDIRLRASAQRAMEAGRPMTISEMYGGPQHLFVNLNPNLNGLSGTAIRTLAGMGQMQEDSAVGSKVFIYVILAALAFAIYKNQK